MARRFTLEGAEVEGVYEIMDHPGGLTRNVVQCLHDFDIPLHLSHTVTFIHGRKRVEAVTVAAGGRGPYSPIKETERLIPCDTLVLSVGLIPENELSKKAGVELDPVTAGPVVDERMETSVDGHLRLRQRGQRVRPGGLRHPQRRGGREGRGGVRAGGQERGRLHPGWRRAGT